MAGTTNINIGGESRPIQFGTNQAAIYCEINNCSLLEYNEELTDIANMKAGVIRDLIYSALFAGCKLEKKEVDFDHFDIGNWIDEMKQEELNKVFEVLIGSNDSGEEVSKKKQSKKK